MPFIDLPLPCQRLSTHAVHDALQALGPYKLKLQKTVSLIGRTVTSHTAVTNLGAGQLPFSFFPHPFFPYPAGKELCKMSTETALVEPHDVLTQDEAGFICWKDAVPTPYPGFGPVCKKLYEVRGAV